MNDDKTKQNDQSKTDDTRMQDQGELGGEAVEDTDTGTDDKSTQ